MLQMYNWWVMNFMICYGLVLRSLYDTNMADSRTVAMVL